MKSRRDKYMVEKAKQKKKKTTTGECHRQLTVKDHKELPEHMMVIFSILTGT
jgi:hypothetical protein